MIASSTASGARRRHTRGTTVSVVSPYAAQVGAGSPPARGITNGIVTAACTSSATPPSTTHGWASPSARPRSHHPRAPRTPRNPVTTPHRNGDPGARPTVAPFRLGREPCEETCTTAHWPFHDGELQDGHPEPGEPEGASRGPRG